MIYVNGEPTAIAERATVADVLAGLEIDAHRGVAVAVDAQVVPRSEWTSFEVPAEARVEIVNAVQGG